MVASLPLTHLTRRVPRRQLLSGLLAVFVLATWVSAAASSYSVLLAVRVVTALSQALFWSVVVPTAAGLFPPRVRGRVIAAVFAGSSLAAVLGLPMGTWLGQQAGWRTAFLALSGSRWRQCSPSPPACRPRCRETARPAALDHRTRPS